MPKYNLSPAQQQRAKLADVIRSRGESPYNIWLVRPPFEEEDLILSSDPAMELFYFLEGDARFTQIDYSPLRLGLEDPLPQSVVPYHFASACMAQGERIEVFLALLESDGPSTSTATRWMVSLRELSAAPTRIANWRRIVPHIRRVHFHDTHGIERQILAVCTGKQRSVRQLMGLVEAPAGLFYGALAALLRRRLLEGDCDTRPWSLNTLVWGAA
ncbi:hypothetical protein JI752_016540 [Lysobacter sp. MMG2]|uniref:hypothetical protein n=1 Tax=Lysobacter sp. MMG2 TaxID=2801338 RepID=UPI001C24F164|nr:hypothetical protein [Lysobacter sp. MMG2]MBU8977758.1 hypothetical protein [Lysobacter sp. MMG2]